MDYELIRSKRKTVSLIVKAEGELVVRAPMKLAKREIDRMVESRVAWIEKSMERQRIRAENRNKPSAEEIAQLKRRAREYLPECTSHFAKIMNLYPTAVKITSAKTRFGSCSGKNSICFSWRLMQYPLEAVDYVVVHELAHIAEKNHGAQFYALVASVFPDWKARKKLLKN